MRKALVTQRLDFRDSGRQTGYGTQEIRGREAGEEPRSVLAPSLIRNSLRSEKGISVHTSFGTMRRSNTTTPEGCVLSDVSRFVRTRSTDVRLCPPPPPPPPPSPPHHHEHRCSDRTTNRSSPASSGHRSAPHREGQKHHTTWLGDKRQAYCRQNIRQLQRKRNNSSHPLRNHKNTTGVNHDCQTAENTSVHYILVRQVIFIAQKLKLCGAMHHPNAIIL